MPNIPHDSWVCAWWKAPEKILASKFIILFQGKNHIGFCSFSSSTCSEIVKCGECNYVYYIGSTCDVSVSTHYIIYVNTKHPWMCS